MAVVAKKTQVIPQDPRGRHFQTLRRRQVAILCLVATGFVVGASCGQAERLDELSLDRWKELREVERYQLNIAEKYYREKNWKVGLAEYEKFLTLYERSVGAPYVQLKWSLCQIHLRKQNTAIKEGFQSVIDYWPDAPQAIAAAYFIGHAYKEMGEVRKAKKAYQSVLNNHPKHLAAVLTAVDLVDLTMIDGDIDTRVALWKQLTFEMPRTRESKYHCQKASGYLAEHSFEFAAFDDAVKALATTYNEQQMPAYVASVVRAPIARLVANDKRRAQGHQLADRAASWLRSHVPPSGATDAEKQAARQHWYFVADVQAASQRADKVTATYEQIVSTFGSDDETLGRFANWYKSKSKYDEARRQYTRYKDKIEGQNQIAYSFRQQGSYDAAVVAYQSNVARDVENPVRWHAEIASTYRTARKYPQAILVYQQLLKTDAKDAEKWLWALATTFRDAGKHKDAIGHFRQCNNFPSNYSEMAACHRALKDYKEAIILYRQIVGGAPQSAPWAMLQIGYTQEQAGKKELAIKAFQYVCKSYPKASYASQAHAHLQNKYKISVTLGGGTDK